ncbi:LptF/LptG family permease, partial [Thermodesulfobacteriota bacterium]
MPFLLYTYLATEILAPFFASLLILTAILFLGRLAPMLDVILDFGVNFPDFIRFCTYLLPNMLLFIIPMAAMIGVIIGFGRMVTDNEVIAMKAGGIGLYRMLPPVIIFAVAAAGATALVSTTLIPAGNTATKQILFRLAKEKIDNGLKEKQFSESLGDMVIYVDKVDPDSRELQGMYVSDMRTPKTPTTIIARSGMLQAHMESMEVRLEMTDGTLHRAPDDRSQTVFFKKYTLKVPLQEPKAVLGESAGGINKGRLTQEELLNKAMVAGKKSKIGASLLTEYHKRLAMPVGCFILSLLGL